MSKAEVTVDGRVVRFRMEGGARELTCKDEALAKRVAAYVKKYNRDIYITPGRHTADGWTLFGADVKKGLDRLAMRWDAPYKTGESAPEVIDIGLTTDSHVSKMIDGDFSTPLIQDHEIDKALNATEQEAVVSGEEDKYKPNAKGFLSKPVYRKEPENGKFYWFVTRTQDGKVVEHTSDRGGGDMRCANKAVAEALAASDMRHGCAVSTMSNGHWREGGDRYIRMERGVVTECIDLGNSRDNDNVFYKRREALGYIKDGRLADPDPEPTQKIKEDEKPTAKVQGAQPFSDYLQALEEVDRAKMTQNLTGVIPEPSEALMAGFQSVCTCAICGHIRAYKKQEADKQSKATDEQIADRIAQALVDVSKVIQDQKKVLVVDAQDLNINANVTQSITSEETNIKESTMANDTKPVRTPSQLELEAQEAALRLAMKQLAKLVHEPLAAAIAAQLSPPGADPAEMKARVGAFLKGEIGSAIVKAFLSIGISSIPAGVIPGLTAERKNSATRELRVASMESVGDTLADLLMEPVRNVLSGLAAGPAAEALTGVRAVDVGLEDAGAAEQQAVAQAADVKKVSFGA